MSEFKLHVAILEHIHKCFPHVLCFHVPNQSRDATEAYFNKIMGVRPGVSDLIIGWRPAKIGCLEIKTDAGKISSSQNKFLSQADFIGWHTGVARSVQQAHKTLVKWGIEPKYNSWIEPDLRTWEQKNKDAFDFFKPQ